MFEAIKEQPKDPFLDKDVVLKMKVEDANVLLSLLSRLPFADVAGVINVIRAEVIKQVSENSGEADQPEQK